MIAIVPIILAPEKAFRQTARGMDLIKDALDNLTGALEISRILVGSDDSEILSLARSRADHIFHLSPDSHEAHPFWPPGTIDLIRAYDNAGLAAMDEIAVVDFRFPMITGRHIDRSIKKYHRNGRGMLISVRKATDHPCQQKTPYRILDAGFIPFKATPDDRIKNGISVLEQLGRLEASGISPEQYQITVPFPFSWPADLAVDQYQFYIEDEDSGEFSFSPADRNKNKAFPRKIWMYETPSRARLLLSAPDFKSWLPPSVRTRDKEFIGAIDHEVFHTLLFRDSRSGKYDLIVNPDIFPAETYVMKTAIVRRDGTVIEDAFEWEVSGLDTRFSFDLSREIEAIGIIYHLYGIVETGPADIWDPFKPESALWQKDKNTGHNLNPHTGEPINGRQDFPDIFEPDGAICITHKDNILDNRIDTYIRQEGLDSLELPPNESIRINTAFDFLRYAVLNKFDDDTADKRNRAAS